MRNSLFLVRDIERAPSCFVCVKTYFRSKTVLHFRTLFFFANTHCRQHTHTRTHNTGILAREATRCGLDDTPPLFLRRDLEQKLVGGAEGPSGQLMCALEGQFKGLRRTGTRRGAARARVHGVLFFAHFCLSLELFKVTEFLVNTEIELCMSASNIHIKLAR